MIPIPSDILQALLGVLAGGAKGYVGTKEELRKEAAAASESEADRQLRRELLSTELSSRESLLGKQFLNEKALTNIKLQAEREQLQQELSFKRDQLKAATGLDRDKLNEEIRSNKARQKQIDKELSLKGAELGLKGRELDVEEAYKLGTGKLGTGVPGVGRGSANANLRYATETMRRGFVTDALKALAGTESFGGILGTSPAAQQKQASLIGMLDTLSKHFYPDVQEAAALAPAASHAGQNLTGFNIDNLPVESPTPTPAVGDSIYTPPNPFDIKNIFDVTMKYNPLVQALDTNRLLKEKYNREKKLGTLR